MLRDKAENKGGLKWETCSVDVVVVMMCILMETIIAAKGVVQKYTWMGRMNTIRTKFETISSITTVFIGAKG